MTSQAFIVDLIKEKGGNIQGRVQLQKLVYFCKALGAEVNTSYKLYIYGPYSQQVANALQDCVADDILIESNGLIQKGAEFESFLNYATDRGDTLSARSEEIVLDVLDSCKLFNTKDFEIVSTTFFIYRQQKALFNSTDKEEIIRKVTNAKGSRFTPDEINQAYQRVLDIFIPLEKKYYI